VNRLKKPSGAANDKGDDQGDEKRGPTQTLEKKKKKPKKTKQKKKKR